MTTSGMAQIAAQLGSSLSRMYPAPDVPHHVEQSVHDEHEQALGRRLDVGAGRLVHVHRGHDEEKPETEAMQDVGPDHQRPGLPEHVQGEHRDIGQSSEGHGPLHANPGDQKRHQRHRDHLADLTDDHLAADIVGIGADIREEPASRTAK